MRRIILLLLSFLLTGPAMAQSDDFDPYLAMTDHMPLAEARPLIEAAYGPITGESNGIGKVKSSDTLLLFGSAPGKPSWTFLFCHERLAGFAAPVTFKVAGAIVRQNVPSYTTAQPEVYGTDTGVALWLLNERMTVDYADLGTDNAHVMIAYPAPSFLRLDFEDHCELMPR